MSRKVKFYRCGKVIREVLGDGSVSDSVFKSTNAAKREVRKLGFGDSKHPNFQRLRVVDRLPSAKQAQGGAA